VTAGPAAPGVVRRRVVVHGRVHGVGFRVSCARRAADAGVGGWVRNTADGEVEAVFEGSAAAVDALVTWCHHGPPLAHVRRVDEVDEEPSGETAFAIR
jgi:acylphosphatase